MKNLKLALFTITIFLISLVVNGQYLPAINRIDTMEQNIINKYGEKWLVNFYKVWEAGKTDPQYVEIMIKNIDGNSFKSLLEDDMDAFIINGRLFALSYKPDNAINESDDNASTYNYYRDEKNSVWLYEKNIKTKDALNDGKWLTANNNPIFRKILGENCDGKGVAYCPQKTKGTGEHFIIKSNKYKGYVVIICSFKSNFKYANRLMTFSPIPVNNYPDGYVYYEFGNNTEGRLFTYYYPTKFTGQDNNGKISTISNTNNVETIQLYLGKSKYGSIIDNTRVSYYSDGDGYGWNECMK